MYWWALIAPIGVAICLIGRAIGNEEVIGTGALTLVFATPAVVWWALVIISYVLTVIGEKAEAT